MKMFFKITSILIALLGLVFAFGLDGVSAQGFCGLGNSAYSVNFNERGYRCSFSVSGAQTCVDVGSWRCQEYNPIPCTEAANNLYPLPVEPCRMWVNSTGCSIEAMAAGEGDCVGDNCWNACSVVAGECRRSKPQVSQSCWVGEGGPVIPVPCGEGDNINTSCDMSKNEDGVFWGKYYTWEGGDAWGNWKAERYEAPINFEGWWHGFGEGGYPVCENYYGVTWEGWLRIDETSPYQFRIEWGDRRDIGGIAINGSWVAPLTNNGWTTTSSEGTVTLSPGWHSINVWYYKMEWGDNVARVYWRRSSSDPWVILPGNDSGGPRIAPCEPASVPSCSVTLNALPAMNVGQSIQLIPSINQENGTIDEVTFTIDPASTGSAVVCLDNGIYSTACSPGAQTYTDTTVGFTAKLSLLEPGEIIVNVSGRMTNDPPAPPYICTDSSASGDVLNPPPWWQVKQGDIQVAGIPSGGGVTSMIPSTCTGDCQPRLIINDVGNYPGVVIATGTISTGAGTISSTGRYANASYFETVQPYDFNYFSNKIPSSQSIITSNYDANNFASCSNQPGTNYCIYRRSGSLDLIGGTANIADKKVILIVEGNLNINTKINLNDGVGFFMAIAQNDIILNASVGQDTPASILTPDLADLEGIYFAQRYIDTNTLGPGLDKQLYIRGMLVARNKVILKRDLSNNALYPGDYIEYAPDQFLHFPTFFGQRAVRWREVAP